jgi:uncharacterized protein (TIGR02611 family)
VTVADPEVGNINQSRSGGGVAPVASAPQTSAVPASSDRSEFEPSPPRWLRPIRDWVHRFPGGRLIWKIVISVVGTAVVVLGLLLVPLPGPGWAIVFLGLAVWATEFVWAQRLLLRARRILRDWTEWAKRQSLIVQGVLGLAGVAFLAGLLYLLWRYVW